MTDRKKPGFTRRTFVGSAAAIGLTTAGGCGMVGDDNPKKNDASLERWDREVDVVVVGSGTGLMGAVVAAAAGLKVLVLEKSLVIGGTTLISGGVLWVPNNRVMNAEGIQDSREQALLYLENLARGQADRELLEAFVDNGADMLEFTAANSPIDWRVSKVMGKVAEYHANWEGALPRGRSVEVDRPEQDNPEGRHIQGGGAILITKLVEACQRLDINIHTSTPAQRLVTRQTAAGQEVIGVEAEQNGQLQRIRARRGVLLASGGYERDAKLKRHYLRGPSPYTVGAETNTGDGIRMGMALGADLRNMNSAWGITAYKADAEANKNVRGGFTIYAQLERMLPGGICVNRHGRRFCNEAADYASSWRTFHTWENWGEHRYQNIPAFQIFDHSVRRNYTIAARGAKQELPKWVIQADTLDALAERLGIDKDALAATVKNFNRHAAVGKDPEFHRGETAFETHGEGVAATLKPLDEPPFYGIEVTPADLATCGGLRVDGKARVIDVFDRPIAGLYASGNTSGVGGPGALYGGGGGTLGPACTFAYIAGKSIVESQTPVT